MSDFLRSLVLLVFNDVKRLVLVLIVVLKCGLFM